MNPDALMVASMPAWVFVGAVIAFYFATETGDGDAAPEVKRGDSSYEPWGVPVAVKKYRLPGDSVFRSNRVIEHEHDTAQFARIKDERN